MTLTLDLGARAGSVAEVEYVLARLRRRFESAHQGARTLARTSVLNLIVYATRPAHAARAAKALAALADRHPSRAIILHHDERGLRDLEADVSLHCDLPEAAGRELCYEQIVVQTRRAAGHRLRSIAIPLLIPDLPVFLWWTGTPALEATHFRDLVGLAHRLIVDSSDFARPEVALPRIEALLPRDDTRFGVTDLNWTRLTPWRELCAQFFDVPAWRAYLTAIGGLRVGFAVDMDGRAIHPSQALLLVGWFAAVLGWRPAEHLAPSEAGGMLFRMRRADGEPIWVRVRPRYYRGVEEGDVTGVRVVADDGASHAEFVVKRHEDGSAHADTEVIRGGATLARRTVLLPAPGVVDLLGEELTITRSDTVYEEALSALCALT